MNQIIKSVCEENDFIYDLKITVSNQVSNRPVGNGWGIVHISKFFDTDCILIQYADTWGEGYKVGMMSYNTNENITWV